MSRRRDPHFQVIERSDKFIIMAVDMINPKIGIQMKRKELTDQDIYDDFKVKKTLVSMVYTKIFQSCKG